MTISASHQDNPAGRPDRTPARLVHLGHWASMTIVAFYILELVPAVGTWSHGQAWRQGLPMVLVLAVLLGLVGAVWHILVNPRLRWPARIILASTVMVFTFFGVVGYYWLGLRNAAAPLPDAPLG